MYSHDQKKKIARILEVPIPVPIWDMLEDLVTEYGNPVRAILASIKAHHTEKFGSLDEIRIAPALFFPPVSQQKVTPTSITDGQIAKITENGKRFEERTKKELEKVDELLQKINDLGALKDLKNEISSMKSMLQSLQSAGFSAPSRRSRAKANLSSLDISIADEADVPLTPPERPALDSVLDSILLFDDTELEDENDDNKQKEEEQENKES
ncbi:MAG: hypothetical protein ACTSQE_07925 [Candidatus Heimdallarchaeaceae archaeon]